MINAVLIGYGKMGRVMEEMIQAEQNMKCVGIVNPRREEMPGSLRELCRELSAQGQMPDLVIDFSHPDNLDMIAESMEKYPLPLIMATTGFNDAQVEKIQSLSKEIPVVYASNFSVGIALMKRIAKDMRDVLGEGFDIEIIEKHHRRKVDSPSGTAGTLADAIDPAGEFIRKYGREGMGKRGKEIGMHSIRGGSIAGEHTVIFAGENELLELTHRVESDEVFAKGAIRAAGFILGKAAGLYGMDQVLAD
ncbi:4-hydroxy-tetrahydrodipicolinate reductase [Bacillota bacterium]